ncbi:MAG TPA: hypothetical protein VGW12_22625 [Pyrinomonadaceae bacterium]|nr:hypothetical protein [Pyrinomonadaceae bacterium]
MNDLPRHTLTRIIAEHGREICNAPKRLEALLRDLCGAHRREINIIIGALEERVAADIITAGNNTPRDLLLARLAARLSDNLAYTPEAARWGVEAWAVALGTLSEAELRARARTESTEIRRGDESPLVKNTKPPANPAANNHPARQQQSVTSSTPPLQTSQTTKTGQPPPIMRAPAQPQSLPTTKSVPPRQQVSPSPPSRRTGLKLRGCFIALILLVLLIVAAVFIAPAVVLLLQEEQANPSVNDPRIR